MIGLGSSFQPGSFGQGEMGGMLVEAVDEYGGLGGSEGLVYWVETLGA